MTLPVLSIWDRWSSGCSLALLGKSDRVDWMDSLTRSRGVHLISRYVASMQSPNKAADPKGSAELPVWRPCCLQPLHLLCLSPASLVVFLGQAPKAVLMFAFENRPEESFRPFQWPQASGRGLEWAGRPVPALEPVAVGRVSLMTPAWEWDESGQAVNSGLCPCLLPRLRTSSRSLEGGWGGLALLQGLRAWPHSGFGIRPMQVHPRLSRHSPSIVFIVG